MNGPSRTDSAHPSSRSASLSATRLVHFDSRPSSAGITASGATPQALQPAASIQQENIPDLASVTANTSPTADTATATSTTGTRPVPDIDITKHGSSSSCSSIGITNKVGHVTPSSSASSLDHDYEPRIRAHSHKIRKATGSSGTTTGTTLTSTGGDNGQRSSPINNPTRHRRGSFDDKTVKPRRLLIDVEETEERILAQEDTDGDFQITIRDLGPKVLTLGTAASQGFRNIEIRGTYMLSNLLQELAIAKDMGRRYIVLDEERLNENPVARLSRMIRLRFWDGLTRRIDASGLEMIAKDPKNRSKNQQAIVYVPAKDDVAWEYYHHVRVERPHLNLRVERLPHDITAQYVKSINQSPGVLSLSLQRTLDAVSGDPCWEGVPFIVPGGRFNEMYGWDSYFETLGLLVDGRVDMCRCMCENFFYQIHYYGKILNANRSYYLTRSQPPFLTDMVVQVFHKMPAETELERQDRQLFLKKGLLYAIKEYYLVWMSKPRWDEATGLSRYHPTGIGMPPETESTHFNHILKPFADKHGVDVERFKLLYDEELVLEPDLNAYFVHDRAVRESGHDTTYRLEKVCADLATVDLNALLFKYEMDIAEHIEREFGGRIAVPDEWIQQSSAFADAELCPCPRDLYDTFSTNSAGCNGNHSRSTVPSPIQGGTACHYETPSMWRHRATHRTRAMTALMWDETKGLWFDYDLNKRQRHAYETVTATWAIWAGLATDQQVRKFIEVGLARFEATGGLTSGTEVSRGQVGLSRPNRQWDYPFGWAPHQIMAWRAFESYGYVDIARRLAYRWLYTITKSFVDFNGVVPEKFDVVGMSHLVDVEYGNVGVDFKYLPREGFGWMNASYQVGLSYLPQYMQRALGALTEPDALFEKMEIHGKGARREKKLLPASLKRFGGGGGEEDGCWGATLDFLNLELTRGFDPVLRPPQAL